MSKWLLIYKQTKTLKVFVPFFDCPEKRRSVIKSNRNSWEGNAGWKLLKIKWSYQTYIPTNRIRESITYSWWLSSIWALKILDMIANDYHEYLLKADGRFDVKRKEKKFKNEIFFSWYRWSNFKFFELKRKLLKLKSPWFYSYFHLIVDLLDEYLK